MNISAIIKQALLIHSTNNLNDNVNMRVINMSVDLDKVPKHRLQVISREIFVRYDIGFMQELVNELHLFLLDILKGETDSHIYLHREHNISYSKMMHFNSFYLSNRMITVKYFNDSLPSIDSDSFKILLEANRLDILQP